MTPTLDAIKDLPFPIAYPLAAARDESLAPGKRLNNVIFAAYQAMRTAGLLLLAEYLEGDETDPAVQRAVVGLMQPHWMQWTKLCTHLAIFFRRPGAKESRPCLVPELADFWLTVFAGTKRPAKGSELARLLSAVPPFRHRDDPYSPNAAFWWTRNDRAHRLGVQDHDDSGDGLLVGTLLPLLEFGLQGLFPPNAFRLLRRAPAGIDSDAEAWETVVVFLHGPDSRGLRAAKVSEEWKGLLDESPVLAVRGERALPVYPLFVAFDPETALHDLGGGGFLEPVYLIDGYSEKRVELFGVGHGGLRRADLVQPLRARLRRKNVELGLKLEAARRWSLVSFAAETAGQQLLDLKNGKYFPEWYVERPDVDGELRRRILRPGGESSRAVAVLVLGEAGSGKSSLLARLAESLLGDGSRGGDSDRLAEAEILRADRDRDVVLFLSGRGAFLGDAAETGEHRLARAVARQAGIQEGNVGSLTELFDSLNLTAKEDECPGRRVFLILDALNEADRFRDLLTALDAFLARIPSYPWLRLVVSMRAGAWSALAQRDRGLLTAGDAVFANAARLESFPRRSAPSGRDALGQRDENPFLEVRPFMLGAEAKTAYRLRQAAERESARVPYSGLSLAIRQLLLNPLHLHLFHETFTGVDRVPAGLDEGSLFRGYLDHLVGQWPGLTEVFPRLGRHLLQTRKAFLPLETALQWRDEFVLETGLGAADRLAILDPVEQLVSASVLVRPTEEGWGSDRRLAGYSFCHQKLAEAVLARSLSRRLPADRPQPTSEELLAWARESSGEEFEGAAPFPELVRAVESFVREATRRSDGAAVAGLLDLENEATRKHLFGACLLEYGQTRGNRNEPTPEGARFLEALCGNILPGERKERIAEASDEAQSFLVACGFSRAAEDVAHQVSRFQRELVEAEPTRLDWKQELTAFLYRLGDLLENAGRTEEAQRLAEEALRLMRELVEAEPKRLDWRRELTGSLYRLGHLLGNAGRTEEAQLLAEEALRLMRELVAVEPTRLDWKHDLTACLRGLVDILWNAGRTEEAQRLAEEALRLIRELVEAEPTRLDWKRELTASLHSLGAVLWNAGRTEEAQRLAEEALRLIRELVEAEPTRLDWKRELAASLGRLVDLLCIAGRTEEAQRLAEEALQLIRELVEAEPTRLDWRRELTVSLAGLGDLLWNAGRTDEAQRLAEEALVLMREVVEAEPTRLDWKRDLAVSLNHFGDLLANAGRTDEAQRLAEESLQVMRELVEAEPTRLDWKGGLTGSLARLGDLLGNVGRTDEAQRLAEESLRLNRELVEAEPMRLDWKGGLAASLNRLGDLLGNAGRTDEAQRLAEESLGFMRELVEVDPTRLDWKRDLTVLLNRLGGLLGNAGRTDEAQRLAEQSLGLMRELVEAEPTRLDWKGDLAGSLNRLGVILGNAGRTEEAQRLAEEDVRLMGELVEAEPTRLDWKRDLTFSMGRLGDLLGNAGRTDEAQRLAEEGLRLMGELVEAEPTRLDWKRDLTFSMGRLGGLLGNAGRTNEAQRLAEEGLVLRRELVNADPTRLDWKRELTVLLYRTSRSRAASGDASGALALALDELELSREITEAAPSNPTDLKGLLASLQNVRNLLRASNDAAAADAPLDEEIEVCRALSRLKELSMDDLRTQIDAVSRAMDIAITKGDLNKGLELAGENAQLRKQLASANGGRWETDNALLAALATAGSLATDLGQLTRAEELLSEAERGSAFLRKAYRGPDTDNQWEAVRNRIGKVALSRGDNGAARTVFEGVLQRRKRRFFAESDKNLARYGLAVSETFVALAAFRTGDREAALAHSTEAMVLLRRHLALLPNDTAVVLELAWALLVRDELLGGETASGEEARGILKSLAEDGPRDDKFWRVMKEAGMTLPACDVGVTS